MQKHSTVWGSFKRNKLKLFIFQYTLNHKFLFPLRNRNLENETIKILKMLTWNMNISKPLRN